MPWTKQCFSSTLPSPVMSNYFGGILMYSVLFAMLVVGSPSFTQEEARARAALAIASANQPVATTIPVVNQPVKTYDCPASCPCGCQEGKPCTCSTPDADGWRYYTDADGNKRQW